jgi:MSHA biogenesis protein MshP
MLRICCNQKGFTLVQAVFILVVLSLLGVVMMRMIGVQSSTSVFALQGARAYQAARSGLEWGAYQAKNGSCVPYDSIADSPRLMIENFKVAVDCDPSQPFTEGPIGPYYVYQLSAIATFGNYGSPDYVSRKVQMKVGFQEE